MCRLVLMNKQGEREIENTYGLEKYLSYLENRLGGQGNGFALMKDRKIIHFQKGLNLSVKEIAKKILSTDYDWAIFHTRLATIGERCDKNCHPFKRKNTVLAMNGTEKKIEFLSKEVKMTDTETILDVITKYNLSLEFLKRYTSIFVGFNNGQPFVAADNTYNIKILKDNLKKAIVFASDFPAGFKNIFVPEKNFFWNGGRIPVKLHKYRHTYKVSSIYYDDYLYLSDYYDQMYIEPKKKTA